MGKSSKLRPLDQIVILNDYLDVQYCTRMSKFLDRSDIIDLHIAGGLVFLDSSKNSDTSISPLGIGLYSKVEYTVHFPHTLSLKGISHGGFIIGHRPTKKSWPQTFIYGLSTTKRKSLFLLWVSFSRLSKGQILRAHFSEWLRESAEHILRNNLRQTWENPISSTLLSHFTTELDSQWRLNERLLFPSLKKTRYFCIKVCLRQIWQKIFHVIMILKTCREFF